MIPASTDPAGGAQDQRAVRSPQVEEMILPLPVEWYDVTDISNRGTIMQIVGFHSKPPMMSYIAGSRYTFAQTG
jgi:hypothetical protein